MQNSNLILIINQIPLKFLRIVLAELQGKKKYIPKIFYQLSLDALRRATCWYNHQGLS